MLCGGRVPQTGFRCCLKELADHLHIFGSKLEVYWKCIGMSGGSNEVV